MNFIVRGIFNLFKVFGYIEDMQCIENGKLRQYPTNKCVKNRKLIVR